MMNRTGIDLSIQKLAEAVAVATGFEGEIYGTPPNRTALPKNCSM